MDRHAWAVAYFLLLWVILVVSSTNSINSFHKPHNINNLNNNDYTKYNKYDKHATIITQTPKISRTHEHPISKRLTVLREEVQERHKAYGMFF